MFYCNNCINLLDLIWKVLIFFIERIRYCFKLYLNSDALVYFIMELNMGYFEP